MKAPVFAELRLLSSLNLDARTLLTVIIAGDERLTARLNTPDMLPIQSRIRTHLQLGYADPEHLYNVLSKTLEHAGHADLISEEVKARLVYARARQSTRDDDHGRPPTFHVLQHELARIDEQVFFDVFKQKLDTGATVTAVCSTANMPLMTTLGADDVLDYTKVESVNVHQRYDFILDAVGKNKTSQFKRECQSLLTVGGTYLSIDDLRPKQTVEQLLELKRLAELGALRPVIDRTYALAQIVDAHRYVDEG